MQRRWYNKYITLSNRLTDFRDIETHQQDILVKGVMSLVTDYDPNLLTCDKACEFPLSIDRKRWYDQDPYIWLMFNTLQMADTVLINSVTSYLDTEMRSN